MDNKKELVIQFDITIRMAGFALAKVCTEEEIDILFDVLQDIFVPIYGDSGRDILERNKEICIKLHKGLKL